MSININNKRWNQNERKPAASNRTHVIPAGSTRKLSIWLSTSLPLIKYECNSILFECIVSTVFSIIIFTGWVFRHQFRHSQFSGYTFNTCNCFLLIESFFTFGRFCLFCFKWYQLYLQNIFFCLSNCLALSWRLHFIYEIHNEMNKTTKFHQENCNRNRSLPR